MSKRTTVSIAYLVNDTVTHVRLSGFRHTAQMWPGGMVIVKMFDRKGQRRQIWHGSSVIAIHIKMRYALPGEEFL